MGRKIFSSDQLTGLIKGHNAVLAGISITHKNGARQSLTLPVISLPEMSHTLRQQLDCTLDGTVHIMSANGGIAQCSITCLDRLNLSCRQGGAKTMASALEEYRKIRKYGVNSTIRVTLYKAGNYNRLLTFAGVLNSCNVAVDRGSSDNSSLFVLVTYKMTGVWE